MEETKFMSLDDKIQRLINNYTKIKNENANLVMEKAELKKKLDDLSNFKSTNSGRREELEISNSKQEEKIEFLKSENRKLREKLEGFDHKMNEASSKLDNIFDQINEL